MLLGADGVTTRRSGVGRVILEAARRLRTAPELAELALLVGDSVAPATLLDAVGEPDDTPPGGLIRSIARNAARSVLPRDTVGRARALASGLPGVAAARALQVRRRLDQAAAEIAARTGKPVLYHEMNTIVRPFSGPTVVTVHDLSWRVDRRLHTTERVAWLERGLRRTLRQATQFISVSEFTASEMVRLLGVDRSRIDVVPPGRSEQFRPMDAAAAAPVLARYGLVDRGYVLSVSTLEPRKNFDRLLAAHASLPPDLRTRAPLVIAGGRGWGVTLANAAAERAQRSGELKLLGFVPDADLVALYARAAMCAYPSLYEGFGLPVIEAMACAVPVVTSETTALRETAGDAALLVDPLDVDAIADALRRVLENDALAAELRIRGPARAATFTWDRMARGMIDSWRTALAE